MNYKIEDYNITQKQITKLMKYLVKLDGWKLSMLENFAITWLEDVNKDIIPFNHLWIDAGEKGIMFCNRDSLDARAMFNILKRDYKKVNFYKDMLDNRKKP
jgi:hypothetical protein